VFINAKSHCCIGVIHDLLILAASSSNHVFKAIEYFLDVARLFVIAFKRFFVYFTGIGDIVV
jgi:hypothetical protein